MGPSEAFAAARLSTPSRAAERAEGLPRGSPLRSQIHLQKSKKKRKKSTN